MARTNLAPNPGFLVSSPLGWATSSSTSVTWYTTSSYYTATSRSSSGFSGSSFVEVVKSSNTNSGIVSSTLVDATPGLNYGLSAYIKVPTGMEYGQFGLAIEWYAANGTTLVSTASSATTALSAIYETSGWTRISLLATAPAGGVKAKLYVRQTNSGTASQTYLVDAILFEQATFINEYFDDQHALAMYKTVAEDKVDDYQVQSKETQIVNTSLAPLPPPSKTGLKLNADIQLNGLTLNTIDENDVVWVCTDIDGWWDLPDPDIPDVTRGLDDGSYDVRGRYTARVMTLSGSILPPHPDLAAPARAKLINALKLVHNSGWLFVDEGPVKGSLVRLSGRPVITSKTARGRIDFQVGLKANDPLKYEMDWTTTPDGYTSQTISPTVTAGAFSSSLSINVSGNETVSVYFKATGALNAGTQIAVQTSDPNLTSYDLTQVQKINIVSSNTSTNDYIEIDTYGQTVLFNGLPNYTSGGISYVARQKVDTVIDWIRLTPGINKITFSGTVSSGTTPSLYLKYRAGWIG
jgi:hypothetical protein